MPNIIIAGASGFIGKYLANYFHKLNYQVSAISRNPDITLSEIPYLNKSYKLNLTDNILIDDLSDGDLIINLSGAGIGNHKWTNQYKEQIISSRVNSTTTITKIINASNKNVKLINASAIGYYGNRESELLNENSVKGYGFLSDVCQIWENTANSLNKKENLLIARFGLIMGTNAGALQKMILPFKFFAGGYIGKGTQYLSWLHIEDLARLMEFTIVNSISGIINFVSPNPITYENFAKILSKVIHRPALLNTPEFIIKMILGESAELVLASQKVIPEKALNSGFNFKYATLEKCLRNLLIKNL
jgi:uncharacterized protein